MSGQDQNSAKFIEFVPDEQLIEIELGRRKYPSVCQPATELVINALDGAFRADREGDVNVHFYRGGHTLSPGVSAIGFLDNGIGFTDEVRDAYKIVGRSKRVGHGRHGIGKFAGYGMTSGHKYFIISSEDDGDATMYEISPKFNKRFFGTTVKRTDFKDIPAKGPFSMILIPDWTEAFSESELIEYLRDHLPTTPWKVKVNGTPVPHRQLNILIQETVVPIKGIPGQVSFSLGIDSPNEDDTIQLIDHLTGRPVASLRGCHKKGINLDKIDPVLRNPRFVGSVEIDGLEDWSTGEREHLSPDFWQSECGKKVAGVLGAFLAARMKNLIRAESNLDVDAAIQSCLSGITTTFTKCFGAPVLDTPNSEGDTSGEGGDKPIKDKGSSGGGRKRPAGGSSGGKKKSPDSGDKNDGGGEPTTPEEPDSVYVRIEEKTYEIYTFKSLNPKVPAEVKSGNVIMVHTSHHTVAPFLERPQLLREVLIRILVEAHVEFMYDKSDGVFAMLYRIMGAIKTKT